jgi:rhodanese-related sulfurtransferase/Ca2+/Na+ antiporter
MKEEYPSGSIKDRVSSGRRYFYRQSISEARQEFCQMDAAQRIVEACLLTAIGTLGITCGFASITQPGTLETKFASRGLDAGSEKRIEKNLKAFSLRYFPLLQPTAVSLFRVDICLISEDPEKEEILNKAGIRVLIGWQMGKDSSGFIGLGTKIISDTYADDEINFLLNLTDNMIHAQALLAARRSRQELKQALDREKEKSLDLLSDIDAAKNDLDHTRFQLSGFNDIFNELSGLKETGEVIDSFLLVLLGIFSASGGYILYLDQATEIARMTCRGPGLSDGTTFLPVRARKGIGTAFASIRALQLAPMQASILSDQQMDCFKPFLPKTAMGLIFKVDETAMGVMGLTERLTQTSYGGEERKLFFAFAKNFLVFLKNSRSFETIQKLHKEQEKKNRELEKTINALSDSRHTITHLEKASERIKTAISSTILQSKKVSLVDISLILIAGIVLGLVYNLASPNGIHVIPKTLLRPIAAHVGMEQARQLFETQKTLLLDARPAQFFSQGHIDGALNLPPTLFDFIYMMRFGQVDVNLPILVYGRNISRRYDEETAFLLSERGHKAVMIFTGGMEEWEKIGGRLAP